MNSHPLHLLKTFRAILDESNQKLWNEIINQTEKILCCPNELNCLYMVNSQEFSQAHFDAALHVLSCINENWVLSK